jgi:hypothetical protein
MSVATLASNHQSTINRRMEREERKIKHKADKIEIIQSKLEPKEIEGY